ncbi:hypothetical protein B0H19DRAFT_1383125, partial [Mycena capillaripes]
IFFDRCFVTGPVSRPPPSSPPGPKPVRFRDRSARLWSITRPRALTHIPRTHPQHVPPAIAEPSISPRCCRASRPCSVCALAASAVLSPSRFRIDATDDVAAQNPSASRAASAAAVPRQFHALRTRANHTRFSKLVLRISLGLRCHCGHRICLILG